MEGTPQEAYDHLANRLNEAAAVLNTHTEAISTLREKADKLSSTLNGHTAHINELADRATKPQQQIEGIKLQQASQAMLLNQHDQVITELHSFMHSSIADGAKAIQILNNPKGIPGTNSERGKAGNNPEFEQKRVWRKSQGTVSRDWDGKMYKIERDFFNKRTENYYNLNQANEIIELLNRKE